MKSSKQCVLTFLIDLQSTQPIFTCSKSILKPLAQVVTLSSKLKVKITNEINENARFSLLFTFNKSIYLADFRQLNHR